MMRITVVRGCAVVCAAVDTAAILLLARSGVVLWAVLPCTAGLVLSTWYLLREGSGS